MIKIAVAIALLTSMLTGCASVPNAEQQARQAEIDKTIPTCANKDDCSAKWDAAQLWIVHHAAYKIQTATNVLIETFNPSNSDTGLAARVTKEPMGAGKYKILVSLWCDNIFGCIPDTYSSALDFNKTVSAAAP